MARRAGTTLELAGNIIGITNSGAFGIAVKERERELHRARAPRDPP